MNLEEILKIPIKYECTECHFRFVKTYQKLMGNERRKRPASTWHRDWIHFNSNLSQSWLISTSHRFCQSFWKTMSWIKRTSFSIIMTEKEVKLYFYRSLDCELSGCWRFITLSMITKKSLPSSKTKDGRHLISLWLKVNQKDVHIFIVSSSLNLISEMCRNH